MAIYHTTYEMLEAMVRDAIAQLHAIDTCGRVKEPTINLIARLEKGLLVAAADRPARPDLCASCGCDHSDDGLCVCVYMDDREIGWTHPFESSVPQAA